ncbi:MAG: hypothetical protein ACTSRZ_11370 [Promethearchaeota archaeon]
MSNSSIVYSENDEKPIQITNINEINNLQYFIEFNPDYKKSKTTNYTIKFQNLTDTLISVEVSFDNPALTVYNGDLHYNLSFSNYQWKIINASDQINKNYLNNEKSELFANISDPMQSNQTFRVDEFLTFVEYLSIPEDEPPKIQSLSRIFVYMGLENYSRNLNYSFEVHHYKASWNFETDPSYSCG